MKRPRVETLLKRRNCRLEALDLNQLPEVQDQIQEVYTNVVNTDILPNDNNHAPLEFIINANQTQYLLGSDIELELKCKVVMPDGSALPNSEPVGIINVPLATMWKHCEVQINSTMVSTSTSNFGLVKYLNLLMKASTDEKNSLLVPMCYKEDTPGMFFSYTQGSNAGADYRYTWIQNSKTFDLYGKLMIGCLKSHTILPRGTEVRIRLYKQPDSFFLMGATNSGYKLQMLSASLHTTWMTLKDRTEKEMDLTLSRSGWIYPFVETRVKEFNIMASQTSYSTNLYQSQVLPSTIYFVLVNSEGNAGSYPKNPLEFQNLSLTNFKVVKNSITKLEIASNFDDVNVSRLFANMFKVSDGGITDITLDAFLSGYTVLGVKVSPSSEKCNFESEPEEGTLSIELTFGAPVPDNTTLLVISSFSSSFTINSNRSVVPNRDM